MYMENNAKNQDTVLKFVLPVANGEIQGPWPK